MSSYDLLARHARDLYTVIQTVNYFIIIIYNITNDCYINTISISFICILFSLECFDIKDQQLLNLLLNRDHYRIVQHQKYQDIANKLTCTGYDTMSCTVVYVQVYYSCTVYGFKSTCLAA